MCRTILIGWIWIVVSIDIYWTIHNADVLIELNPLADWIIKSYGIDVFCAIKVFNTYVVTEILRRLSIGYTITMGILALILLGFLFQ